MISGDTRAAGGLGLRLALLAAALVYLASAVAHVRFGGLNPDEGFYAVATRAVAAGELPYRDFGFTQPPGVLYANALPLRALGFGLFPQRAVNGAWAGASLVIAAALLARRARPTWSVALILGAALSSPWMYFMHLGKTYGFTSFLVMVGTWIFLEARPGRLRHVALGAMVVIGTATRLPAGPFFAILALQAVLTERPAFRSILTGFAAAVAAVATPFLVLAPAAAWFWIFEFQHVSVAQKHWHLQWPEIATLAPAPWLLAVVALGVAARSQRRFDRPATVGLAAMVTLLLNLVPAGVYEEYATPFLLPLVVASALRIDEAGARWRRSAVAMLLLGLAAAQGITAPWLFRHLRPERQGTWNAWLPYNAPDYHPGLGAQLQAASRVVSRLVPPGRPLIGSNLILATETGRAVPADLRMGPFALTNEMDPALAARLHLVTPAELDALVADPQCRLVALFPNARLNFSWSMPSFELVPEVERRARFDRWLTAFAPVFAEGDFLLLARRDGTPEGNPPP